MKLAGPLIAVLSVAATLAVLETTARVRLSPTARAALPHVGATGEMQRRLEWVERGRADGGAESWQIDVPDPLLGWRPKAGIRTRSMRPGSYDVTVSTNAQGLRGRDDVIRERAPGVPRIAVFGCSQTFGSGVEDDETFSARLAASLPGVEVLNFGVHGYGTDQMLLRWEEEGVRYAPDVVVIAFAYYHLDRNITGFRFYAKPHFVFDRDGALRLVGVPVPDPDALSGAATPHPAWPLADRSVLARWLWERELRRRDTALYQAEGPAWDVTKALITRFATGVRRTGARFVILNIDEDAPWMAEPLAHLAHNLDATFVDAGPALGEPRSRGIRLRLPRDPHWNPQGHAVIADVLHDGLCSHSLVRGCENNEVARTQR
jgi:hypothetical protein